MRAKGGPNPTRDTHEAKACTGVGAATKMLRFELCLVCDAGSATFPAIDTIWNCQDIKRKVHSLTHVDCIINVP